MLKQFFQTMGTILFVVFMCGSLHLFLTRYVIKDKGKGLPVSLPEELSLVKTGDTLYVTEVSDSIYIGFRK